MLAIAPNFGRSKPKLLLYFSGSSTRFRVHVIHGTASRPAVATGQGPRPDCRPDCQTGWDHSVTVTPRATWRREQRQGAHNITFFAPMNMSHASMHVYGVVRVIGIAYRISTEVLCQYLGIVCPPALCPPLPPITRLGHSTLPNAGRLVDITVICTPRNKESRARRGDTGGPLNMLSPWLPLPSPGTSMTTQAHSCSRCALELDIQRYPGTLGSLKILGAQRRYI